MANRSRADPPYTALFAGVKILDIGLTTTYFFIVGLAAAKVCDHIAAFLFGNESKIDWETYPLIPFTINVIGHLFFIGVLAYVLRNMVHLIPFPFDGVAGFQHERLKELNGGAVLLFMIFLFQKNLTTKMHAYASRFIGLPAEAKVEIDNALE
jgi:hypothetical protein